jgi:hypothetical protein
MNNTVKTALGGMCIALSTAIMLASSLLPTLTYAIPGIAALLVLFMQVECNSKWAFAVFFGTSIISALIVPYKEAVGIYIALLGYYPLVKTFFDKPKNKYISLIIKSVFFTVVIVATYWVMMRVFGISTELLEESEKFFIPVLVILGLVAFLLYDKAMTMLEITYYRKWQRTVRKLFKRR